MRIHRQIIPLVVGTLVVLLTATTWAGDNPWTRDPSLAEAVTLLTRVREIILRDPTDGEGYISSITLGNPPHDDLVSYPSFRSPGWRIGKTDLTKLGTNRYRFRAVVTSNEYLPEVLAIEIQPNRGGEPWGIKTFWVASFRTLAQAEALLGPSTEEPYSRGGADPRDPPLGTALTTTFQGIPVEESPVRRGMLLARLVDLAPTSPRRRSIERFIANARTGQWRRMAEHLCDSDSAQAHANWRRQVYHLLREANPGTIKLSPVSFRGGDQMSFECRGTRYLMYIHYGPDDVGVHVNAFGQPDAIILTLEEEYFPSGTARR